MSRSLPIALIQTRSSTSLDVFESKVREVSEQFPATELIVFPELHLTNPSDLELSGSKPDAAKFEAIDGPRSRQIGEIARRFGVWLIPGSVFESDAGAVYNTLPVYSPDGELVTSYRKVFPWRPYEKVRPGNKVVSFDIPGRGRVGLTICYDAWFPEIHRQLAWNGCDVIVNVVLTATIDREQELVLAKANAIVNQVFIASVNAAAPSGVGQSLVVDPEGRVRSHSVAAEPCVITDVLHLGLVEETRERGTAGLNCLWNQFEAGDEPLELPVYEGRLAPEIWSARTRAPAD